MAKLNQVGKWGSRPGRYRSALTTALLALAACGGGAEPPSTGAGAEPPSTGAGAEPPSTGAGAATRSGDSWITIEGVQFPAVFAEAPDEIVESYVFAARHPEVLSYMPCYCGCERETPPHASNYDCFIDAIDRTGPLPRVDPDPMGFG